MKKVRAVGSGHHGDLRGTRWRDALVVVHDLYPSKEALDGAIASGSTGGFSEQFEQLDELLVTLGASVGS